MENNIKDFMDYFTCCYYFPNVSEISFITPKFTIPEWDATGEHVYKTEEEGILFEYVSEKYLLSHINHVKILDAYGIHRYTKPSEKDINNFYEDNKPYLYGDDIIILAKTKHKHIDYNLYYFFYLDRDVSDCLIGSFVTSDDIFNIQKSFIKWVNETNKLTTMNNSESLGFIDPDDESFKPIKIDVSKLGWWS